VIGDFKQNALDDISVEFRKAEFVTVLGPSGCGKTTMLNVIGGLDHADKGDLIINDKSTKNFEDIEWDMYRNNSIGFIFQSHNLISHLSVLQNVEMGLSLSGVSQSEAKKRAIEVLDRVGLKDHIHKRPNQLSGGQSQRVAIARALANNPDVILADEPTGSLDSETSIQILDLIRDIAKDKLVIMVTHDSEMAYRYATRIIKLKDGRIIDDSDPIEKDLKDNSKLTLKKTSMSFRTALVSSFNNISTKLGRTLLTAFAGSIGIIGIALILSLSNGLDKEIDKFERDTLSGYPITVTESRVDFQKIRESNQDTELEIYPDQNYATMYDENRFQSFLDDNNITEDYVEFVKEYVENEGQLTLSGVKYQRKVNMSLLAELSISGLGEQYIPIYSETIEGDEASNPGEALGFGSSFFTLLPEGQVFDNNYEVIYGTVPVQDYEEEVFQVYLVVNEYNQIFKSTLQILGFDTDDENQYSFDDIVGKNFKLYMGEYDIFTSDINDALNIEISGIIRAKEGSNVSLLINGLGYDSDFASYLYETYPAEVGGIDTISLYPNNFENKDKVKSYLDQYNFNEDGTEKESELKVEYVDQASLITSMVGGVIDTISIVLIAFAAISLVVSSIMISIITYISVIERTKEIGVLRALGARKKDISRVFNSENLIIGLAAGLVGIIVSILLIIPINIIIENLADMPNVAKLAPLHMIVLILISVFLAYIAGFIPARMASKKDPVIALRTE
ncbi:MAG: ATP-binding cassette domain-containing protein, partial [Candidatus Izemoplasmatales bacterium]|nr:ATP-binding cassette domain-containing protein [Candidatus Izemoplasmatales bacterium]